MILIFAKHVRKYFAYLTSNYQCRCVKSSEEFVRYENDEVFVDIRYDNGWSYELNVEIGRKGVLFNGQERPFNLGEVLRLKKAESKENFTLVQASNQQILIVAIKKLADLLKRYAIDLLQGDPALFSAITSQRETECVDYEIERKLNHVRAEAGDAWAKKDYAKIVKLYAPVEQHITLSEKKKLTFAKKHIGVR